MSERIAAIIPALNAASTLPPVLEATKRFIDDVIVVDDGSSDDTGDVARAYGVIVIRHDVNRGKGAALKTGFQYVLEHGYDAVVTLDADGQHLPSEIPKFIAAWHARRADLIIGSRRHLFTGMLPRRRLANQFSAWSISKAAGVFIEDSQSGFRLYSRQLLNRMRIHADGFDAESEVIVRAGRRGFTIEMLPIDLGFVNGISTSHYLPVRDTVRIAWTVFRTRMSEKKLRIAG